MYALYIANKNYSSWSLRPWVLLRELDIAFEERVVPFEPKSSWATFRTFSPSGKVPCLINGNEVVWDSLAITEYLAERHAGVWPANASARAWARCAAAEMHSGFVALRNCCSMSCGIRARLKGITAPLQQDIDRMCELWNEGLSRFGGPFLGGTHFGAVDAFFAPIAFRVQTYSLPLDATAMTYASSLLALSSMQNWYADALAEPWREDDHEAEVRKSAEWMEDRRTRA